MTSQRIFAGVEVDKGMKGQNSTRLALTIPLIVLARSSEVEATAESTKSSGDNAAEPKSPRNSVNSLCNTTASHNAHKRAIALFSRCTDDKLEDDG